MVSFKTYKKSDVNNMVNDFQAAGSDDEKGGLNTTTAAHGTTEKGESFTYLMKESTKVSCNECDFAL